jgi:hypothetical protein
MPGLTPIHKAATRIHRSNSPEVMFLNSSIQLPPNTSRTNGKHDPPASG